MEAKANHVLGCPKYLVGISIFGLYVALRSIFIEKK
jgi:hypothetical protein